MTAAARDDMSTKSADWLIDTASADSFPASDPPAYGSSHAVASESTVCPPELMPKRRLLRYVGIGALGAGIVTASVLVIRYARNR